LAGDEAGRTSVAGGVNAPSAEGSAWHEGRKAGLEEAANVVDVPADAAPNDYIGGEEGVEMLRSIATSIRHLKERK
jgi:hypothetical protein